MLTDALLWQPDSVTSRSARVASERPFYDQHADAYDLLIKDPVEPWVDAVDNELRGAGLTSASILDAGCGTGRHARGLIDRGHHVVLLDASRKLLALAHRRCPEAGARLDDICSPAISERFDAVVCRGVLNDLVTDDERDLALASFAHLLKPNGLLLLDIRETVASRLRADGESHTTEARLDDGRLLVFTARSTWQDDLIVVTEQYDLVGSRSDDDGPPQEYSFRMRPWQRDEIERRLAAAGFSDVEVRDGVGRRTPDRLFVVAVRTPGTATTSGQPTLH